MLTEILSVVAPLFICAGIGFVWGKLDKPFDAEMMTGLALHLGVPCLVFSTLTKLEISPVAFGKMAGAYTLALVLFIVLAAVLTRLLRLEARAFIPALTFRNSGNLGLPVCLFAFGEAGLAYGIGCFVIASLAGLTVGRGIYAGSTASEALFRNPIVYAIAISLVFMIGEIEPPACVDLYDYVGRLRGFATRTEAVATRGEVEPMRGFLRDTLGYDLPTRLRATLRSYEQHRQNFERTLGDLCTP